VRELRDLRDRSIEVDTLAGAHQVHPAHQVGQTLQRHEHAAQQRDVDGSHDEHAARQHGDLGGRQRRAHGRRRERENERGEHQHAHVDRDHAPEQRHICKMPLRSSAHHGL
jgi:hypothetical protein